MASKTERVRALNDELRQLYRGGTIVLTDGIRALDDQTLHCVDKAIANFAEFTPDNDPHGEHDFGCVKVAGETIFFKIDCYDLDHCNHSPDPADPSVTRRVMTVMLAEEY